MKREPKVYIALENEAGQLVVQGPLELLDRLVAALAGQGSRSGRVPEPASEPQEAGSLTGRPAAGTTRTGCARTECARTECATTGEADNV